MSNSKGTESEIFLCDARRLPEELQVEAAREAIRENPQNAGVFAFGDIPETVQRANGLAIPSKEDTVQAQADFMLKGLDGDFEEIAPPARLAVNVNKHWATGKRLSVQFVDSPMPSAALRQKIISHMNAWSRYGDVSFTEVPSEGNVRITLKDRGYWSYVGTDITVITSDKPTMSLEGFNDQTPDSDFLRTVRHETGHTLGFEHEHMRKEIVDKIDTNKAISYFRKTYNWDEKKTRDNVLTPLADNAVLTSDVVDDNSVMCYVLPGEIMKDGKAVRGGPDISALDADFASKIYPIIIPDNTYYIQIVQSQLMVDLKMGDTSSGTKLWAHTRNFTPAQSWAITHVRNGFHKIVRINTSMALTFENKDSKQGAQVIIREFEDAPSMLWRFLKNNNGTYTIVNADSNLALTLKDNKRASDTPLVISTESGSQSQQFHLNAIVDIPDGTYYINIADTNLMLDGYMGLISEGNRIWAFDSNQTDAQKWIITKVSGDIYKIIRIKTNKALAYVKTDKSPQPAKMLEYRNKPEMQWRIVRNFDGTYAFVHQIANVVAYALSVPQKQSRAYAEVAIDNLSAGQRFVLRTV